MKIKRFMAKDMRHAIREVREALGPDAVILSNQKVNGGIEIVAAIDYDEALVHRAFGLDVSVQKKSESSTKDKFLDEMPGSKPRPESVDDRPSAGKSDRQVRDRNDTRNTLVWSQEPTLKSMRSEITTLRHMLETQLASLVQSDQLQRNPMRASLLKELAELGISGELATELTKVCSEEMSLERNWNRALVKLNRMLSVDALPLDNGFGACAIVGPTGVGKTTTVARLAARLVMRHGIDQVALVTLDTYRIGARDQLEIYARLLGVPMFTAGDATELRSVLQRLSDRRCVLIDTAGMSQRDLRFGEQLAMLDLPGLPINLVLALSAAQQAVALDETVRRFAGIPLQGCILTKLDEAACLGGALTVAVQHRIPVLGFSDGQRVPEDLHPASAHQLLVRAVDAARKRRKNQTSKAEKPPHAPVNNAESTRRGVYA